MRRVLVVEDSVSTRAFVRAVLESADPAPSYEVVEASSGFDAMRLLPRGPYHLIITDLNMGDINGLELIRFVRSSGQHRMTPLMIISSLRAETDIARGLALGADAFLSKPFTAEQLRETCVRLLSSARATAAAEIPPDGTPSDGT
ncbi:MAG: response regulator [Myxococcota bacterium]|nr:response regulator [Myxococcota bacterium]